MPPISSQEGAVTLVNMRFCPYAQRTVLCLNAKNVDYEVINSQLMKRPEWLNELNPLGKVPILFHNGHTIYESLITCEYIEDVFPGVKLHSEDPARRAKDRMLVELFNKVIMPQMRIMFGFKKGLGEEDRANHWAESLKYLNIFELELSERGKEGFFSGNNVPGFLDYMIWPWFERLDAFGESYNKEPGLQYPREKFPVLSGWMERMMEDKAVKDYHLDTATHAQFLASMGSGSPNYNLLSLKQ